MALLLITYCICCAAGMGWLHIGLAPPLDADLPKRTHMDRVTYIASIVGLMVVGAMTASMMMHITTPLSFTAGQTTMKAQEFIDKYFLLAAASPAFHPGMRAADP